MFLAKKWQAENVSFKKSNIITADIIFQKNKRAKLQRLKIFRSTIFRLLNNIGKKNTSHKRLNFLK